jgi:hypothetical protein
MSTNYAVEFRHDGSQPKMFMCSHGLTQYQTLVNILRNYPAVTYDADMNAWVEERSRSVVAHEGESSADLGDCSIVIFNSSEFAEFTKRAAK